ncbi:MAG TPA: GNAT family N-acetyltransferase [Planctomycetota bacterium]|nr:GNAT family N-acetyltransferase [Planctomycetota bacterium]
MSLSLRPLDAAHVADFHAVLGRANAEARACLCTAAYVETWKDPTLAAPCRARMLREGTSDGFLLYEDGRAVGWCQAAPRDTLVNLVRGRGLAPDPSVWAISCLVLAPEAKGRGLSRDLLKLVLAELARRGVVRVQVIACRYGPDEDTSGFVELPESLCRKAGMALAHDHPMRPIYDAAG